MKAIAWLVVVLAGLIAGLNPVGAKDFHNLFERYLQTPGPQMCLATENRSKGELAQSGCGYGEWGEFTVHGVHR